MSIVRTVRRGSSIAAACVLLQGAAVLGAPSAHTAPAGKVGVLLMDHGEPPEYDRTTYPSFRAFIDHLMEMGVIPSWLRHIDTGTVLQDSGCYACAQQRPEPTLVDAWLDAHDGTALFVPSTSEDLPPHYVLPGGPGLGEPDIFEHAGLQVWNEWKLIGGRSPNYAEKLAKKQDLIRRLKSAYGSDLAIRIGYGIDPRIGGRRQGIHEAVRALVVQDKVRSIVAVYHGVGFSDIMQTHMLRHEVHDALEELGADVSVRYAKPMGTSGHYLAAVVEKVQSELLSIPKDAAVAIHLSGHGLPTTTCGSYECGRDAYHAHARALFARASKAVRASVRHDGRFGVFSVYGDGSDGDADPGDKADSPLEGLRKRKQSGYRYVIDIPYEFDSNSRDTLIVLRHGYGRTPPDWNSRYESRFTSDGIRVKIANASGAESHKIAALEAVARAAIDASLDATASGGHHHHH